MASTAAGVRIFISVALTVVAIGMSVSAAHPDASPGQPALESRRIEGTWRVQITLVNCETGTPVAPPFPALATFSRGGTVVTSDGGSSPSARGAGHGVWRFAGPGTYEAFTEAFMFANGVRIGTQQIQQEIQIGAGGAEFTSRVNSRVLNIDGNVVFAGCASSAGQRME